MAGFKLGTFVIAIVIFLGIISGMSYLLAISFQETDYESLLTTAEFAAFNDTYNRLNETTNLNNELSVSSPDEPAQDDFLNIMFKSGYNTANSVAASVRFFDLMILRSDDLVGRFLPNFIPPLIVTIVGLLITFAVLSIIMNRDII